MARKPAKKSPKKVRVEAAQSCERCGKPQPSAWKAGELCVHCGRAVRRDVRCFWCAKWTPFAKFCKDCGAEVVEERLYGAARMLKDAGTDRFNVPRMLRELDPDQVENFTRIYQRQAGIVARHADDVRFLEKFLFKKGYAAELEEELVPQLPWPEETLARLVPRSLPPGGDLDIVKAIFDATPFPRTRGLAALARVRLDDWKAVRDALAIGDPDLRGEAALVLTGWRVRTAVGRMRDERWIVEELRKSPFRLEAGVRLAQDDALLREALASPDRETAFAAALALGEVERLQAALAGDDLERIAAGNRLIGLGVIRPVEEPIRESPLEVQRELVDSLARRDEPAPELADTLLGIVETTEDDTLRERAARVLCRKLKPEWALRVARAARKERYVFQSLLKEEAGLPPEAVEEVLNHMVSAGLFAMHQYGLKEAAARGAAPEGFVPAKFPAADDETRKELLRFAEAQLEARGDEALHRFVMNVIFGPYSAPVRSAAWWTLHRWYRRDDHRGYGPLRIERVSLERFFGSARDFLPKLAAVLADHDTLKEVGVFEFLANLLKYDVEESGVEALRAEEVACRDLVRTLTGVVEGSDSWAYLRTAAADFLGVLGKHPSWSAGVLEGLERVRRGQGFDLTDACDRAMKSIRGETD